MYYYTIGAFVLSSLFFMISNLYLRRFVKSKKMHEQLPLYDFGHEHLPELHYEQYSTFNDILVVSVFILALYLVDYEQKGRLLFLWTLLSLGKTISMWLTIMPHSNNVCEYKESLLPQDSCHDMLYSGHTMTLLLAMLFINDKIPLPWYVWVAYGVSELLKIGARCHYSVDVFLAIIITFLVKDSTYLANVVLS